MARIKQYGGRMTDGDYFRWLCDSVDINKNQSYYLLLKDLFSCVFVWTIPNDDNRVIDAVDLQVEYFGFAKNLKTISVLEVLIALSLRMGDMIYDENHTLNTSFFEMISNLGLDKYDDENHNSEDIYEILTNWMNRDYNFDGSGGIFPLQKCNKNQTEVELWYQMSAYVLENYEF